MLKENLGQISQKLAQATNEGQSTSGTTGITTIPTPTIDPVTLTPEQLILNIINYSLFFIGAVALGFVIYGAILFITSGGDSDKTTKARNTLLYAVIGIVVVVLSWTIINWAAGTLPTTLQSGGATTTP